MHNFLLLLTSVAYSLHLKMAAVFLRSVCEIVPYYTVLDPRRQYSSAHFLSESVLILVFHHFVY